MQKSCGAHAVVCKRTYWDRALVCTHSTMYGLLVTVDGFRHMIPAQLMVNWLLACCLSNIVKPYVNVNPYVNAYPSDTQHTLLNITTFGLLLVCSSWFVSLSCSLCMFEIWFFKFIFSSSNFATYRTEMDCVGALEGKVTICSVQVWKENLHCHCRSSLNMEVLFPPKSVTNVHLTTLNNTMLFGYSRPTCGLALAIHLLA